MANADFSVDDQVDVDVPLGPYGQDLPLLLESDERTTDDGPFTLGDLCASAWLAICLLYTSPSPRDQRGSRMPSSA